MSVVLAALAGAGCSHLFRIPRRIERDSEYHLGTNLTLAITDIIKDLPVDRITVVYDQTIGASPRANLNNGFAVKRYRKDLFWGALAVLKNFGGLC